MPPGSVLGGLRLKRCPGASLNWFTASFVMSARTAGMLIVIDIPLFVTFFVQPTPQPCLPCFVLVPQCERVMYLSEYGHLSPAETLASVHHLLKITRGINFVSQMIKPIT